MGNRCDDKTARRERARSQTALRAGKRLAFVGLPPDADCRLPVIALTGKNYLRVEHHTGIMQLTGECVRLYSRIGLICIRGRGFTASRMDDDVILINGSVDSVGFE